MFINKKPTRGAALIEYGILVGLVSVLAIGAVLATGNKVSDIFSDAQYMLASSISNDGISSSEVVEAAFATWTITAATITNGSTELTGYRNEELANSMGTRSAWSGDAEIVGFHRNAGASTQFYVMFRGNHLSSITNDMVVTCTNGLEMQVAAGTVYTGDAIGGITFIYWNPAPEMLTVGQEYQCSLAVPDV